MIKMELLFMKHDKYVNAEKREKLNSWLISQVDFMSAPRIYEGFQSKQSFVNASISPLTDISTYWLQMHLPFDVEIDYCESNTTV